MHARYLRIPSWSTVRCRRLAAHASSASSVSIEIEKHRPIPVDEPIQPETAHGGASADGVLFEWADYLAPGTPIEIEFSLQPQGSPVTLRGEVVDAKACENDAVGYRIRMGFIAGTEAEVDTIAEFVRKFYG